MSKELRIFDFEIRAEQDEQRGSILTGRPVVFGQRTNLGWYDEIIEASALDATDLKDVRLLVNHNTDMIPLARSRNNTENSTMQLIPVPDVGMDFRASIDTENNADAKSLYSAVIQHLFPSEDFVGTLFSGYTDLLLFPEQVSAETSDL